MNLQSSGGKAAEAACELEEMHQMNEKNHQMLHQQLEEDEKWKKEEAEAARGMVEDAQPTSIDESQKIIE